MGESAGWVVGFVDGAGVERQVPLEAAAGVPLEECRPVRGFPSYRGQRNWPGLWWAATTGGHVGFESWLERDHVMLLDFDPVVVGFSSQPFWLFLPEAGGRRWHAPDLFVRRRDGSAVVLDCRPDEQVASGDAAVFAATERACASVGWGYRRVGAVDPVLAGNVRWLAGYRHPRFADPVVADRLRAVFAVPRPLLAGGELVGRSMAVLPVLFHLLWRGELRVDLTVPLTDASTVWAPG